MTDHEIVVIGGGVMGSAAAWALARAGHDVAVLERFGPLHINGASHGAFRNFNTSYPNEPYVSMLVESRRLFAALSEEVGVPLLELVGLLRHGGNPLYPEIVTALAAVGQAAEVLDAATAQERWPQFRIDREALWIPEAGRVRAADAWRGLQTSAVAHGAELRFDTEVTDIRILDDDRVEVRTSDGVLSARRAIVTVGGWSSKLLAGLAPLPELRVTQEQPAHFRPWDAALEWPTFMHDLDRSRHDGWLSGIYGMRSAGEGIKAGWHGTGPVVDPDHRDFLPVPAQLDRLREYARTWLPGVDADAAEAISCTYTTTASEDFVLDRVGPLVIGAGFSGHGFKFAPVIGRILADLASNDTFRAPDAFRLPTARARLVV